VKRSLVQAILLALLCAPLLAPAAPTGDGYDSDLALAVRAATERYRLVVWAEHDGYVQTTDYIASFGTMYTNHERFDPKALNAPTVLVYDLAGRLVACGYQFLDRSAIIPALAGPDVTGWYDIPKHLHYNITVNGTTYFAQQPWNSDQQPTAALLVKMNLMPADAKLQFAFVHPPARAIIIWAWTPNPSGLFESDNPALP
jgi:hypothetical protein